MIYKTLSTNVLANVCFLFAMFQFTPPAADNDAMSPPPVTLTSNNNDKVTTNNNTRFFHPAFRPEAYVDPAPASPPEEDDDEDFDDCTDLSTLTPTLTLSSNPLTLNANSLTLNRSNPPSKTLSCWRQRSHLTLRGWTQLYPRSCHLKVRPISR